MSDTPLWELRNVDCLIGLRDVVDASVNLVIADPPYNIGFKYHDYDDNREPDDYLAWCCNWLEEVFRVVSPAGTFWCAIGPKYVSELDVRAKNCGFHKRSHVIWHYTFGVNSTKKLTPSHTHLLYYVKDPDNFVFNVDAIKVPSARERLYGDKRAKPGGRLPNDVWALQPQEHTELYQETGDTWHIPRVAGTFKERVVGATNQLPEQVVGRIISACSQPGDLILDPFVGSGTTLAVATKLDRRSVGFELSETAATAAIRRLSYVAVGDQLS